MAIIGSGVPLGGSAPAADLERPARIGVLPCHLGWLAHTAFCRFARPEDIPLAVDIALLGRRHRHRHLSMGHHPGAFISDYPKSA
jgi:hypothetical protein